MWIQTTLIALMTLTGQVIAADPMGGRPPLPGGAACVMAKWQGNTLDYALSYGKSHPVEAQEAAEQMLSEKGYDSYRVNLDIMHAQGFSHLPHAFVIVIRSDFKTGRDKDRTSYGCGFSHKSYQDAEWGAVRDLQSYSWGWKPDRDGYEVVQRLRY